MSIIVLAATRSETSAFTQRNSAALGYGIRHILSRHTIKGIVRPTEVHELASFRERPDIHALKAELERVRRMNPELKWFRYDADGELVETDGEPYVPPASGKTSPAAEPAAPRARRNKRPKPPEKVHFSGADVAKNSETAIDTSPDAVPGQTAIEEHIDSHEAAVAAVEEALEESVVSSNGELDEAVKELQAAQNPRSDPDDEFLKFMDS